MAKPLDRDEIGMAQLLARAGVPPASAHAFAVLARGGGHTATDLAAATGTSRQDAGDAANALLTAGLARVDKVPSGPSGGRPTNRYHLATDGLAGFLRARRAAIAAELAALDELDERFAPR